MMRSTRKSLRPGNRPRRPDAHCRPRLEPLEDRIVPSLTWTTYGEGATKGNTVTMGDATRGEADTQPIDFHGASAPLPAGRTYDIAFEFDLSSWDSYNADAGPGTGYWDSFSVSITSVPYPKLDVLKDPLQLDYVWGANTWGDGILENNKGTKVISKTFNVAGPHYINIILDTKTTPTADANYPSFGTVTVITGDLAIVKADNTEVPDDKEQSPGGYVAVNNDNDNYNFTGAGAAIVDKDENAKVVGESDLVPLKLHPIDPAAQGGTYKLVSPSASIKLWKTADKDGAVVSDTTEFDATKETTVYVEGITKSTAAAKEEIALKWTKGALTAVMQRVKYTVYEVTGPTNVPDYSLHTYKASVPGTGTPKWTASDGTVKTGADKADATILWGGGPVVGKATFSPADGFKVDREVNVVQIKVDAPAAGAAFTKGTPVDGGNPVLGGVISKLVKSGAPALEWKAKITLSGPNGDRGVKEMRVGFIQNLVEYRNRGTYDTVKKTLKANIEGLTPLLDRLDTSAGPWYEDVGAAVFFDPSAAKKTKEITSSDTPTDGPPLTDKQGGAVNAGDDVLDSMELLDKFSLAICARTTDTANDADKIYTRRAAIEWSFNGDGTVGQAAPYAWTAAATAKITAPAAWGEIKDGSQPAKIAGSTFNQELNKIKFT